MGRYNAGKTRAGNEILGKVRWLRPLEGWISLSFFCCRSFFSGRWPSLFFISSPDVGWKFSLCMTMLMFMKSGTTLWISLGVENLANFNHFFLSLPQRLWTGRRWSLIDRRYCACCRLDSLPRAYKACFLYGVWLQMIAFPKAHLCRNRCRVDEGSMTGRWGVDEGSMWGRWGVDKGSMRGRCRVDEGSCFCGGGGGGGGGSMFPVVPCKGYL